MRLLTRYILREVASHALLGGVLFTFVLFTTRLRPLLETLVRNSATLSDVFRLILYFLPEVLIVTIPMAVLVGILLGLSRLAADSEITAMRASGMGAFDFVRIVSLLSFAALALGLLNSIVLEPLAADRLLKLENSLKYAQASFEVEPRVFDEDFRNMVLYVQDVVPGPGTALWRHVFLADLTQPAAPKVTTAAEAFVTSAPHSPDSTTGNLHLLLRDGGQHQISPTDPNQYNISTFAATDLPIQNAAQDDAHLSRSDTRNQALTLSQLLTRIKSAASTPTQTRLYRIELNRRFSYPFACLVLMLVGVPLGLSSKRGGKSTGFVLTILLVFVYYLLSSVGIAFATQGKLSPFLGVWGANLLFTLAGLLLLQQMTRGGIALSLASTIAATFTRLLAQIVNTRSSRPEQQTVSPSFVESRDPRILSSPRPKRSLTSQLPQRLRSLLHIRFPLILDEYILRTFAGALLLVTASFSILFLIFTFFELIGDIVRNRTPLVTVGEYLLNLIPYILYNVVPLCVLVAVLITFGALARSSEFTAMKAAGFSLYRVVAPVLLLAAIVGAALFAFDNLYLPEANRRQEALRAVIKGRPAQTFLRPDRQWISGQTSILSTNPGAPSQTASPSEVGTYKSPGAPSQTASPSEMGRYKSPGAPSQTVPSSEVGTYKSPGAPSQTASPSEVGTYKSPGAPSQTVPPSEVGSTTSTTTPSRIFYYQFFDPDRNVFANLTVFEFDPATFTLGRRIFATSAHWDPEVSQWLFENGWVRAFSGATVADYRPFTLSTFPEIHEQPAYFKKEDRQSQEMNFSELTAYIKDLQQSGFDTRKLSVQLDRKLAYPFITLVMAVLAVPFALSTGKRSGITGFAIAILLAVSYLGIAAFFEAMGNVNQLPPTLAAWAPDLLFTLAGAWFLLRTPT